MYSVCIRNVFLEINATAVSVFLHIIFYLFPVTADAFSCAEFIFSLAVNIRKNSLLYFRKRIGNV